MSIVDALPVRLWWDGHPHGGHGEARYHDVERHLTTRPDFMPFWSLQFTPGLCCIVQPVAYPWRDMTRAERLAALDWLRSLQ